MWQKSLKDQSVRALKVPVSVWSFFNSLHTFMQNLQIVQVDVKDLNPAAYNPRKWDKEKTEQLMESIQHFGLVDPIIVNSAENRNNIVIGGHFRLHVAKKLGYKTVPVVYVNIPDLEKEKELNLRLNKNTGDWDFDLLKGFDIDLLSDVGFESFELDDIFADCLEISEDDFNLEKELKIARQNPQTKTGDLINLGKHRLICGDSTDPQVLEKLLGGIKIDMIYTDPPYNLKYDYQKGLGKKNKYDCEAVEDSRSLADYQNFLEATLGNALPHLQNDAHIFYYCDQNYVGIVQAMYRKFGIKNRRTCLWIKNNQNTTPQVAFNKCYEPCVYGTRGKPYLSQNHQAFTEVQNGNVANGNQTIEDISHFLDLWLVKRLPTADYLHPTQKPLELHEKPLKRCTKFGDKILDFFGGSGSTLIACEQLNRTAFLVEKDPAFCDVIISRYKKLIGEKN